MEINFLQVLFQAVNFGVILFVLNKFLYKPIRKVLDDRADKINSGLQAAQANLKAQEEIEKTKKVEVAKARREAAKVIAAAKKEAEQKSAELLAKTKEKAASEAERILASARAGAKASEKELAASLKELTVASTRRLLAETLSAKEIDNITKAMIAKLK